MYHDQRLASVAIQNMLHFAFDYIFINDFHLSIVMVQLSSQLLVLYLLLVIVQIHLFNPIANQSDHTDCAIAKP